MWDDSLAACRRMVEAQRELFASNATIAGRTRYDGYGEGGDHTLVIDRQAEDIVFAELEGLHEAGSEFTAISEERGVVTFGNAGEMRVVIDPIDGSLNARRTIPAHSLSIAIAAGPAMADVEFAYVYDFGAGEEFTARRGGGALLDGSALEARGPGHGLEIVGLEGAKPERMAPVLHELEGKAFRIRAVGSIAITLCWVACGRLDGMLTGRACRSVDAAAAQLVAREAGALVEFPGFELSAAPLDLEARYHLAGALDEEMLATLREAQTAAEPAPDPS
ncbi:MAG: inositol monophosphatase family protein [Solirubrobacterales bacterium]